MGQCSEFLTDQKTMQDAELKKKLFCRHKACIILKLIISITSTFINKTAKSVHGKNTLGQSKLKQWIAIKLFVDNNKIIEFKDSIPTMGAATFLLLNQPFIQQNNKANLQNVSINSLHH